MLTEDLVIYHVRDHLVGNGWEIVSLAILNKCGTDEVAVDTGIRLELEVRKGSSKPLTRRYAKELNSITCAAASAAVPT